MKSKVPHSHYVNYAEDQPEYKTLPVLRVWNSDLKQIEHVSCFSPTFLERLQIFFKGEIFLSVLGHQPPVRLATTLDDATGNNPDLAGAIFKVDGICNPESD
jgi:hypothetical protein